MMKTLKDEEQQRLRQTPLLERYGPGNGKGGEDTFYCRVCESNQPAEYLGADRYTGPVAGVKVRCPKGHRGSIVVSWERASRWDAEARA